jgi:prepilin-type N-terminal cleavage/methylation domain-containing protein
MFMLLPQRTAKQNGFTIVELLIVIVVIGILAAITIVAFNGVNERAVDASLQSDIRSGSNKVQASYIETGDYPSSLVAAEVVASGDNEFEYTQSGTDYCLTVANPNTGTSYYIDNETNVVTAGLCPGHTLPTPPVYAVFDAASTYVSPGYNNSTTTNHTIGAGDNRYVLVFVATRVDQVTGVTYGGTSMQQIVKHVNTNQSGVTVYGLENPPTGVSSVVTTFGDYVLSTSAIISYSNMYQGGGNIGGYYDNTFVLSGYSETPSLSIDTTFDRSLVLSILSTTLDPSVTTNPGVVRADIAHSDANLGRLVIAEVEQENTGTVTTDWTILPIDNYTIVNAAFRGQ